MAILSTRSRCENEEIMGRTLGMPALGLCLS
jgi:hypothetical protein